MSPHKTTFKSAISPLTDQNNEYAATAHKQIVEALNRYTTTNKEN